MGESAIKKKKNVIFRDVVVDFFVNKLMIVFELFQMANLCWWYYISKLTEFADTVFFVLRKKDSQVTFLHLYHHSLTPLETWILVKFLAGKLYYYVVQSVYFSQLVC